LLVKLSRNVIEIANKADLDDIEIYKIFERFYTTALSRTSKNTGLGLAIAKELVAQINIKISAKVEDDMLKMQIEF
jgi:signal transduction histidine kinase